MAAPEQDQPAVPFPPYDRAAAQARFPGDAEAWQRIGLLREWLAGGRSPRAIAAAARVGQSTLYVLRSRWERAGIAGLLSAPPLAARRLDSRAARDLLHLLGRGTTFQVGTQPLAARLLPHQRDPAARGHMLSTAIERLVGHIDAQLAAQAGGVALMRHHFLLREHARPLARAAALSERALYALLAGGVSMLAEHLPGALPAAPAWPWAIYDLGEHCVGREAELARIMAALRSQQRCQVTGLSGIGKTTLMARVAEQWHRMGWNVIWARYDSKQVAALEQFAIDLHRQLAGYGLLRTPSPDPHSPPDTQLRHITATLAKSPTLLIIDDAHAGLDDLDWHRTLVRWQAELACPLVLIAQTRIVDGPEVQLHGLAESAARRIYVVGAHSATPAEWEQIYARTAGHPQLLHLTLRTAPTAREPERAARELVAQSMSRLSPSAQRLLAWLLWLPNAVHRDDPLLQAAAASSAAWRQLGEQQLAHFHDRQVVVHDIIRRYAPLVLSAAILKDTRSAVIAAARRFERWEIAYRCAEDSGDLALSYEAAAAAARQLEQSGQMLLAVQWWDRAANHARQREEHWEQVDALLGAIRCEILTHSFDSALARLRPAPPINDPLQRWWWSIYTMRAYWLANQPEQARHILETMERWEPDDPATARLVEWMERFARARIDLALYNFSACWHTFLTLGPPPTDDVTTVLNYYALGSMIALERRQYAAFRALSRQRWQTGRTCPHAFLRNRERLAWAIDQFQIEHYAQAHRILKEGYGELEEHWEKLRARYALIACLTAYEVGHAAHMHRWTEMLHQFPHRSDEQQMIMDWIDGLLAHAVGDLTAARARFDSALRRSEHARSHHNTAEILAVFLVLELQRGDIAAAERALALMWALIKTHRLLRLIGRYALCAARVAITSGQAEAARVFFARAARWFDRHGLHVSCAEALAGEAHAALAQGLPVQALRASQRAVDLVRPQGLGMRYAPWIWACHAQSLQASDQGGAAAAASDTAWAHLRVQAARLPKGADRQLFLSHPMHAILVAPVGAGAERRVWPRRGRYPATLRAAGINRDTIADEHSLDSSYQQPSVQSSTMRT